MNIYLTKLPCDKLVLNLFTRLYCQNVGYNFKPIEIPGLDTKSRLKKVRPKINHLRPRYLNMDGNEDWTNVWPVAKSFNSSVVPLPLRQGRVKNKAENNNIIPDKYGNSELIKIPNFLHLTPFHIEKHCNAIKKYCTEWPKELTDDVAKHHFPLEFKQSDYIHSAPSLRDERARVVTLTFELKALKFDEREKFKFIKLLGPKRYDKKTDTVTIVADRCPSNRQNYDYLIYVLTALSNEAKKFESWELEVEESDWVDFSWEKSELKGKMESILKQQKTSSVSKAETDAAIETLKSSVEKLYNEGDSVDTLEMYKASVLKLLNVGNKQCEQSTV